MRRALIAVVVVAFLLATTLGVVYGYRVAMADQTATRLVVRYCQRRGYDTSKLIGPSKEDVPHTAAAYRWYYRDGTDDLMFFLAFHGFYSLTEFDVFDRKRNHTHYPLEDGTL